MNWLLSLISASWRTRLAGFGTILATLGDTAAKLFDGNDATNPDWTLIAAAIMTGWGLLVARDNKVTSEQVIATAPPAVAAKMEASMEEPKK